MGSFTHAGRRLAYTEHGSGERLVVLLHGLLLSQKLVTPLARSLADAGNRVVTLDLLGHGRSDRPTDMTAYSMTAFGEQVVGLLDHLDAQEAVVGGVSLGANVALETAVLAPERVRGMIVEMPVLDDALLACAVAFTPLMLATTVGAPVMQGLATLARLIPTARGPWLADTLLDTVRQDPRPSGAVLQGLFFARVAPPAALRREISAPALVIGHRHDPVHPFSDADRLVTELPAARMVQASSMLELRLRPERLTAEMSAFLDEVWRPTAVGDDDRSGSQARRVA